MAVEHGGLEARGTAWLMAVEHGGLEARGTAWLRRAQQSMQARLDDPQAGPKPFHKVPPDMRLANPTDYHPIFFTFGPCHAKLEVPLSSHDLFKVQIAQALTTQQSFNNLLVAIERRDRHIRKIYKEYLPELQFDISPQVLAYLLALDALTIVAGALYHNLDLAKSLAPVIMRDAGLLEQQLPLFILEAAIESLAVPVDCSLQHDPPVIDPSSCPLYIRSLVMTYAVEVAYPFKRRAMNWQWLDPSNHEQSMLSHIYRTLEPVAESVVNISDTMPLIAAEGAENAHHCCGMRLCCAQRQRQRQSRSSLSETADYPRLPTASKLRHCGIHFKAGDGGFRGIKFDAATSVVTLPEIWVFDNTKPYLLNLVAHEVLLSLDESPVTSYILMMDHLIDTEEDVKVLVDDNILHNKLGSHKELAEMWNTLAVNLSSAHTRSDGTVIRQVSEASRQCLRKCWAGFRDTYCEKKPWLFISIIAAVCLFVLTFLQTTYTILQYNHPR